MVDASKKEISRQQGLKIKRAIDLTIGLMALIILFIPALIAAIAIKLETKGPAFFFQIRAGKNGKPFKIIKFRSMVQGSEKFTIGKYVTQETTSVTRVGRFLRRWALDELPQILNVIKGNMSIIGPRPTLPYQVEKYDEFQKRRLGMKPGLTGWAQVNGRNKLTWPQRFEYDGWYVENWSLGLDLKILLRTVPAILKRDFAFAEEEGNDGIVSLEE